MRPIHIPLPPDGSQTLVITNPTPELRENPRELKRIAEQAMRDGVTTVDYSAQQAPAQQAPAQKAAPINPTLGQRVDTQRQMAMGEAGVDPRQVPEPLPRTDAAGLASAALRGLGPYAAGAGVGFAAGGPVGAGLGAASVLITKMLEPAVVETINQATGGNFQTLGEYFTSIGLPEADTEAERTLQAAAEGLGDSAGMLGLGMGLGAGIPALGGAQSTSQGVGRVLTEAPVRDLAGGAAGAAGSEEARQLAEKLNLPPWLSTIMQVGAGIAFDIMGGSVPGSEGNQLTLPTRNQQRTAVDRMGAARIDPTDVRRAVSDGMEPAILDLMNTTGVSREVAERALNESSGRMSRFLSRFDATDSDVQTLVQAGVDRDVASSALANARRRQVPVFTSDAIPPLSPEEQGAQAAREAFGQGRPRTQQETARRRLVDTALDEFDAAPGNRALITQELSDSFVETRQTAFNTAASNRQAALATVPEDAIIDTSNALAFLDAEIARYSRMGESGVGNVNATGVVGDGAEVAGNVFQGRLHRLQQTRNAIENKDRATIENWRRELSDMYKQTDSAGHQVDEMAQTWNTLYSKLRDDLNEAVRVHGGPEQYERIIQANNTMSDLLSDLNDDALRGLLRRANESQMVIEAHPETIYRMVNSSDPSVVQNVMSHMTYEGRDQVNAAILDSIATRATRDNRNISSNQFTNLLHQEMDRLKITLAPEQQQRIQGIENLLDITRRSESRLTQQLADTTKGISRIPSGRYTTARFISGNLATGAGIVGGFLLTGRNLSRIYESPQTRDMLLELASGTIEPRRAEALALNIMRTLISMDSGQEQPQTQGVQGNAEQRPIQPTMEATIRP